MPPTTKSMREHIKALSDFRGSLDSCRYLSTEKYNVDWIINILTASALHRKIEVRLEPINGVNWIELTKLEIVEEGKEVRYLVVCEDALIPGRIRTSEHFPTIVHATHDASPEDIMQKVFGDAEFRPRANKVYFIIPMNRGKRVTFKPKRNYDIEVEELY